MSRMPTWGSGCAHRAVATKEFRELLRALRAPSDEAIRAEPCRAEQKEEQDGIAGEPPRP
eukprot:3430725-Alexandrium_andersonii.AAC.1